MSKLQGDFPARISGIPCQVLVESIEERPALSGSDSDWDSQSWTDVEYTILDRKGYKAAWLGKRMTDRDHSKVKTACIEFSRKETAKC